MLTPSPELTRSHLAGRHWLVSVYERTGSNLINFSPNWIRQTKGEFEEGSLSLFHGLGNGRQLLIESHTIDAWVPDAVDARDGI